jgi:hypothetical protein
MEDTRTPPILIAKFSTVQVVLDAIDLGKEVVATVATAQLTTGQLAITVKIVINIHTSRKYSGSDGHSDTRGGGALRPRESRSGSRKR